MVNFDLFPTLLELAGIRPPLAQQSRAVSLLAPETSRPRFSEDPAPSRTAITMVRQSHPDWDPAPWQRRLQALVEQDHKLIRGSDGRQELFDLAIDPEETRNLIDEQLDQAERMTEALKAYLGALQHCEPSSGPPPDLTPEQIERLKALGYLGG